MPQNAIYERMFKIFYVLGLVFIAFVFGAISFNYQLLPTKPVRKAIMAAEALYEQWNQPKFVNAKGAKKLGIGTVEKTIKNARVYWDRDKAYSGYTLYTLRYSTSAYLVNMEGKVVHRWNLPFEKAFPNPTHVNALADGRVYLASAQIFANGDILAIYASFGDTPYGYGMVRADKDSNILWTYNGNTHHDFYLDEANGNIYALTHYFVDEKHRNAADLPYPMLVDFIEVLSPEGKLLEQISLLDLFADSPYSSMMYHRTVEWKRPWDIFHTNTIMKLEPEMAAAFPMFKAGQVLLSIRNMDAIAVIDIEQKKVVWAFNGLWKEQHGAKFLPNGNISIYDNKGHIEGEQTYSRLLEFDPKTLSVAWQYAGSAKAPFYSSVYGRMQKLPNGNWLSVEPERTRIFEITKEGDVVWNYSLPTLVINKEINNWVVDARRYADDEAVFLSQ